MRFIISILITAILAFVAGIYLPWWSIAIAAFAVSLFIPLKPFTAFLSGFFSVFILWLMLAAFISANNNGILAARVGQLFGIGSPSLLMVVTSIVGGLVAGFAALTASYIRKK